MKQSRNTTLYKDPSSRFLGFQPNLTSFIACIGQNVDPYKQRRITLGGLADHVATIKHGRRIIMVACGTSFHACLATRQCIEELAQVCLLAAIHAHSFCRPWAAWTF